ncbi:MAG: 5-oxoprolinase subunit PxpB [Acidobacteria bacterium]|nr:5-oxoprolinase subunit PxpB [Acidobacteriota bacterium]
MISERVAEDALLVRFEDADLRAAAARAHALATVLEGEPDIEELVPGAASLLVLTRRGSADAVAAALERVETPMPPRSATAHEIAVRWNGPDLAEIAQLTGRTPSALIEVLTATPFTVAFVGFQPGFPYLVGLPPELHVPRLASPRTLVPAGSFAIAGPFAGIYPFASPGGWRLLGETDIALFDAQRVPPALLRPGDAVRLR